MFSNINKACQWQKEALFVGVILMGAVAPKGYVSATAAKSFCTY